MIARLLVLGGGSEIGAAVVERLAGNGLERAVLAGRSGGSLDTTADRLCESRPGLDIVTVDFDGAASADHRRVLDEIDRSHGPFDAVLVAFGQLGNEFTIDADPAAMAELASVNFSGAVSSALASLEILRGEPNARLIVISSIAAVRPRIGNIVYGSAKAGLDAFARELAGPAAEVGVDVVVLRPGFVHTAMTEGLEPAPFATTPEAVAEDLAEGLRKGRSIIHSPGVLGPVGLVLKNLPGVVWRRLSKR